MMLIIILTTVSMKWIRVNNNKSYLRFKIKLINKKWVIYGLY
jgi:hypothetical protein